MPTIVGWVSVAPWEPLGVTEQSRCQPGVTLGPHRGQNQRWSPGNMSWGGWMVPVLNILCFQRSDKPQNLRLPACSLCSCVPKLYFVLEFYLFPSPSSCCQYQQPMCCLSWEQVPACFLSQPQLLLPSGRGSFKCNILMFLGVGFGVNLNTGCPWIAAMDSVKGDQEKQVQSYSGNPLIPANLVELLRLKLLLPYFLFSLS